MTSPAGPQEPDPKRLLEALREESFDWPPMDVETALRAWNFYPNPDYQSQWGEQQFIHPDYPDLDVTLPMNAQKVHPRTVEHTVTIIDRLIRRLG